MRFRPAAAAFVLSAAALAAGDNWPQYRGPTGDGISDAKDVPTKWSETENVRWKTAIHDKGWSSPVVWGHQVWVTTASDEGKKYYAVCLDRSTGKVVHDVHLFDEANPPDIRQFNTYASPTPAIEEGRLYAHFGSHGTVCLDTATGKKIWERRDLECNHFRGPASSAVVYKDWLFLNFDGFDKQYAACLDKHTGKTVWTKDRDLPYPSNGDLKKGFATPAILEVDGKPQFVSSAATGTIAYDPATGTELWRVITDGMNQASRPILAHGLIYVTAGHKGQLWAIKAGKTGTLDPAADVAWKMLKGAPSRPSPVVLGDLLFAVNDTGVAVCLDAKTGKEHWRETFPNEKYSASPVYAAGNLYFPGENGKTFVVAASKTYEEKEVNKLDAGCRGSPAVAGDAIYLRTLTHLYCIGKK